MFTNRHKVKIDKHQKLQDYYSETADLYDSLHLDSNHEHQLALHYLSALIKYHGIKSILDVGAGTGRVARFIASEIPEVKIMSIEPSEKLRDIAIKSGVKKNQIAQGDIYHLPFGDAEYDLVCAFGVFHHLEDTKLALKEMKRVSRKFLFFSDSNNFGQGKILVRNLKLFLRFTHLWKLFIFVRTKGKKYTISYEDGLTYSFSLLDVANDLHEYSLKFMSTRTNNHNFLRTASHFALFAARMEN
jgi:ubiquinone/menaquinone biosynthesis C-methylase UbiE